MPLCVVRFVPLGILWAGDAACFVLTAPAALVHHHCTLIPQLTWGSCPSARAMPNSSGRPSPISTVFHERLSTISGDTLGIALCRSSFHTTHTSVASACLKFRRKFHHRSNTLEEFSEYRTASFRCTCILFPHMQILCLSIFSFPQRFPLALLLGHPTGQHEQRIAETVKKFYDDHVNRLFSRQPHAQPFSPTAHGSCMVQEGRDPASTWKYKFLERSQVLLATINQQLQARDVLRCHLRHVFELLPGDRRQNPARIKQLVLDPPELVFQSFGGGLPVDGIDVERPHHSHQRVQLIHGAVDVNPQAIFPDFLSPCEPRLACIPGPRV